ncbi:hypothetical protein ACXXH0_00460 [Staphylococcus epidermidis]
MQNKSKKSRELAHKIENEYSDLAANRFYFSCFQKLLYLAQTELQYSRNESDKSSHMALILFVEKEINIAMKDESKRMKLIRAKNIKSAYLKLKQYRIKADYHDESISMEEIKLILEDVKTFDSCYQIIKDEM